MKYVAFRQIYGLIKRPSIYKIVIPDPDNTKEAKKLETYGWMNLHELIDCVNAINKCETLTMEFSAGTDLFNIPLFTQFGAIETDADGIPRFTWACRYRYCIKGNAPLFSDWNDHAMYVPATFGNGIIDMAQEGIIKVSVELVPSSSKGGSYYERIAYLKDGTRVKIDSTGNLDHPYRFLYKIHS